jgi:hypothetical protein
MYTEAGNEGHKNIHNPQLQQNSYSIEDFYPLGL